MMFSRRSANAFWLSPVGISIDGPPGTGNIAAAGTVALGRHSHLRISTASCSRAIPSIARRASGRA